MREIRRTIRLSGLMSGGEETSDRQRRLPPTLQNFRQIRQISLFLRFTGIFFPLISISYNKAIFENSL